MGGRVIGCLGLASLVKIRGRTTRRVKVDGDGGGDGDGDGGGVSTSGDDELRPFSSLASFFNSTRRVDGVTGPTLTLNSVVSLRRSSSSLMDDPSRSVDDILVARTGPGLRLTRGTDATEEQLRFRLFFILVCSCGRQAAAAAAKKSVSLPKGRSQTTSIFQKRNLYKNFLSGEHYFFG
mgnify:CR=1 FL=1